METLQTALASREDTGPFKKPLFDKKVHCNDGDHDETNYVDLGNPSDMKSDSAKTVKVTFTGEGNQLAIIKCKGDASVSTKSPVEREDNEHIEKSLPEECFNNEDNEKCYAERLFGERAPLIRVPSEDEFTEDGSKNDADLKNEDSKHETEELQYTDMYLNSRCESKDSTSTADVESHYITTHEIQLTELDHDVDYEVGRGSCWDFEDDNLVYSFVDYASFESDETTRKRIQSKVKSNKVQTSLRAAKLGAPGALISTESELCESDKCASSDEGVGKTQHDRRNTSGPIHLSIKSSSRAINEHVNVLQQKNLRFHTRRAADRQYSFRSSDSKSETLYDRCFIPPPGRQHLASKLRVKDINEYSSGASSSVSELDDADKEVRNLTARSFRSLACPYFDTIHLSSSSESSMSEHSLSINKWSAFVDLNYSNLTQGLDQNMLARRNSTPVMEGNHSAEYKNNKDVLHTNIPNPQTNILSLKNNLNSRQASSGSSKKIEIRSKPGSKETITLTETLNFSCNAGGGIPARERRAKRSLDAMVSRSTAEVMGIAPAKPGCETDSQVRETSETFEDTHKKAIFASSLLKNIISKKMQFEQELKMERGEIYDTHIVPSLFPQQDAKKEKEEIHSENSETESGHSQEEREDVTAIAYCVSHVEPPETMRSQPAELTESPCDPGIAPKLDPCNAPHIPLTPSQTSAFKTWKDGEQESEAQGEGDPQCALEDTQPNTSTERLLESSECVEGESSKMIKMSHLYVPSSQLMPKEKEAVGLSLRNLKVNGDVLESDRGGCAKFSSGQLKCPEDTDKTSPCQKAPEIKIRICSVKENQGNRLNIAKLLTPNIHYSVNPKKATNESKTNLLNIPDKVPHFMVRDIRDNKCKFQTPIHQVRDVRKLVKSSYRFVALENASGTLREDCKPILRGPDNKPFPTPMVIKCQSVNTNSATKYDPVNVGSKEESEILHETARTSPNLPPECASKCEGARAPARVPCLKHPLTEQHEFSLKIDGKKSDCWEKKPESKVSNQGALEKLRAAVKTMEQLYVFDRNEWKRKAQAPQPITDSHLLSLITREEQGVATKTDFNNECGRDDNEKFTSCKLRTENLTTASCVDGVIDEGKMSMPTSSHSQKELVAQRAVFRVGGNLKPPAHITVANESTQKICSSRNYTHKAPLSLKICPSKAKSEDRKNVLEHQHLPSDSSDKYLTIPVKASNSKLPQPPKPSHQPLQRSPIVMKSWSPETQTATIYHDAVPLLAVPAIPATQPQVLCLTPPADPLPLHVQRKLLLDPTTGQYYLVDTPVPMQQAAQRFCHPESGQFLDIPFSLTPVPVSVSPVTLSPAAYPPTYLVYPSTMLATHPHPNTQSHSSTCSEGDDTVETGSLCMIQPGMAVPSSTKPVISITSQQSARIVAPPSFDGTTMSFVVEHR
ncbi:hypothetical protein E1301_Tti011883 [Triplophysa tibetana]|uniref:DUF4585 domain-containing protein n=1 Tax=Triplophysa tibetana TaxID=1572043 RepID=A0A5A9PL18_9TELE|nr:hypothetical protein E1301_Tti011883 [Triplophysa tibetana]